MHLYWRGKKAKKLWCEFKIGTHRFRLNTHRTDKRAALEEANKLRKREERRLSGFKDHEDTRSALLSDLVADFAAYLPTHTRKGRPLSAGWVQTTLSRLRRVLAGRMKIAEVTAEFLEERLDAIAEERKLTAASRNQYRIAVSDFFGYLIRKKRLERSDSPMLDVARAEPGKKTFNRRALTEEELVRLVTTAPYPRNVVYLIGAQTGYRRSELRRLTRASADLEARTLSLAGRFTKNGDDAVQPLTDEAVEALRTLLAERPDAAPDSPLFVLKNGFSAVPRMPRFRADLIAAKIDPGKRGEKEVLVDFHAATRVTLGTALARAGVGLKQAADLTRHKTVEVLARDYMKLELVDARAAVEQLPRVGAGVGQPCPKSAETRATPRAGDPPREDASSSTTSLVSSAPVADTSSSRSGGIGRRARFRGEDARAAGHGETDSYNDAQDARGSRCGSGSAEPRRTDPLDEELLDRRPEDLERDARALTAIASRSAPDRQRALLREAQDLLDEAAKLRRDDDDQDGKVIEMRRAGG